VCHARAGRNWAKGYKTYRAGHVVGFVPALDRREVREISARFLSQDEWIEIADLHRAGVGVGEIARRMGRAPSTISRELRRNATGPRCIARSRRSAVRLLGESVIIAGGSTPTPSCDG
jgi:hypothetical protein